MIPPDSVGFFRIPKHSSRFVRIPQVPQIPKDPSGSQTPKNIMGGPLKFSKTPLIFPKDSSGFLRILKDPLDSFEFRRVLQGACGFPKFPEDSSGCLKFTKTLQDSFRFLMDLQFPLDFSGFLRILQIPQASFGLHTIPQKVPLNPSGFRRSPLGSLKTQNGFLAAR